MSGNDIITLLRKLYANYKSLPELLHKENARQTFEDELEEPRIDGEHIRQRSKTVVTDIYDKEMDCGPGDIHTISIYERHGDACG